jgi:hypothetical protein
MNDNNHEIVLAAMQSDGLGLKYASERLKDDHGIVLAAVQCNRPALQHASKRLKDDRAIVVAGVAGDFTALQWASERLKRDILREAKQERGSPLAQSFANAHRTYCIFYYRNFWRDVEGILALFRVVAMMRCTCYGARQELDWKDVVLLGIDGYATGFRRLLREFIPKSRERIGA